MKMKIREICGCAWQKFKTFKKIKVLSFLWGTVSKTCRTLSLGFPKVTSVYNMYHHNHYHEKICLHLSYNSAPTCVYPTERSTLNPRGSAHPFLLCYLNCNDTFQLLPRGIFKSYVKSSCSPKFKNANFIGWRKILSLYIRDRFVKMCDRILGAIKLLGDTSHWDSDISFLVQDLHDWNPSFRLNILW